MSETIIRIEQLSKYYRIGTKEERYSTLRDTIANGLLFPLVNLRRRLRRLSRVEDPDDPDVIRALDDVSFEIEQGEVVGVIGRNGAGKSTLLKILSRITEPTAGRIELYGRVSSLLEVGTGFHPELTGRENISLNGAILGMSKAEINRNFDQIVEFSEIERFIDTPVKRYSSGMYVRLAFAVAAHLESDILLVDEVLAVGDAAFQKKCLGKMNEVAGEGRTVLFVSHHMPMITSLTSRCILLDAGRIVAQGNTSEVILKYYSSGTSSMAHVQFPNESRKPGDEYVELVAVVVLNSRGATASELDISEPVRIRMHYRVLQAYPTELVPNFNFYTSDGTYAFVTCLPPEQVPVEPGDYLVECMVPGNLLNSDTYFVNVAVTSYNRQGRVHLNERSIVSFNVKDNEVRRKGIIGNIRGALRPLLTWTVDRTA